MQYIDENMLLLSDIFLHAAIVVPRNNPELGEDALRAYIASCTHLSAVPYLKEQLAPDRPLWEILALLELYAETEMQAAEARNRGAEDLLAEVSPDLLAERVKAGLRFDRLYPIDGGKHAYIPLRSGPGEVSRLVLRGLDLTGPLELDHPVWWELIRHGEGYRLSFMTDAFETLHLDFEGLEHRREIYRADADLLFVQNPWQILCEMAKAIVYKALDLRWPLNEREQALMPLLYGLQSLSDPPVEPAEEEELLPLRNKLLENGLEQAAQCLMQLASAGELQKDACRNKLFALLRQAECEPLWRELHQAIQESQADLPAFVPEIPQAAEKRRKVAETLHRMGFSGDYPFFWKEGAQQAFTVLESYDQTYFVWKEPHALYLVQAVEEVTEDTCGIHFLVGTVFGKKEDYAPGMHPDIYGAMFEEKGRRRWERVLLQEDTPLEKAAGIAGKKAQLKKLDKAERAAVPKDSLILLLLLCLLMGLGFGIGFTLLFGLFVALILWIGGELGSFWEIPWLFAFLFATFGFGGCMAVVLLLQRRK